MTYGKQECVSIEGSACETLALAGTTPQGVNYGTNGGNRNKNN